MCECGWDWRLDCNSCEGELAVFGLLLCLQPSVTHDLVPSQAPSITGKLIRKIALQTSADCFGLAISPDGAHMVTSHDNHTLSVYSLPGGEHVCAFGKYGPGRGRFKGPRDVCFSIAGNILVAEQVNQRVQEVTLTGNHVRFIGVGVIGDEIRGLDANAELIVVCKYGGITGNRIMMFDAVTGAFVRAFSECGAAVGQVMMYSTAVRFTPDSRHIIVAECSGCATARLSVFTLAGEFVRCVGEGELQAALGVAFDDNGDVIVADSLHHGLFRFPANDLTVPQQLRLGGEAGSNSNLYSPAALGLYSGQLYVLDRDSQCVQVFE